MQTQPFADLIAESLDEAQFLWGRWEAEQSSLTRNLDAVVSWTEDRLHGALDGVRVAPETLFESLLSECLAGDVLHRVTVAAHLLATAKTPNALALLSNAVSRSTGAKLAACIRGIEVAALDGNFKTVTAALANAGGEQRAALCRLKAFRRATLGQELVDTFESGVPALQAQALRSAVHLSDERVHAWIRVGLGSPHTEVRQMAMITGIRRRNQAAWDAAVQLTRMAHKEAALVFELVAMFGATGEQQAIVAAANDAGLRKAALGALGSLGTRDAIETCLQAMSDEAVAAAAAEAYCAITGADLERDKLVAQENAANDVPLTFEQDDLNADLTLRDEQSWPKPDVDSVHRHWQRIQSQYTPGARYLNGCAVDIGTLTSAIESGPMLRRPRLIVEAGIRTQGGYDVEWRDFSAQQRRMMAASRARVAG